MAKRGRSPKRGPNYVQIISLIISFLVVLSMILAVLPIATQ